MEPSKQPRPFNQPLELGLRALYILDALAPKKIDIQKILFFDYLLVHSADIEGPASLHAPVPYRTGEWLAHRPNLEQGLLMFAAKELLFKEFTPEGILYSASELTKPFISHLKSDYSRELTMRSLWLIEKFGSYSSEEITKLMFSNIFNWGRELQLGNIKNTKP